jgi:Zn-dependent protease
VAAAVVGVGAVWFALSILTGLIFHFLPAAPIVVAVWVERSYGPDRPLAWRALSAHVAGGVAVSVAVWSALWAVGAPLDAAWQVVAAILAGIGVATWLGRRGAS